MIRCIAFNFDVKSCKSLLYLLNPSPLFSRKDASPYFTTVQYNEDGKIFKYELLFIPHEQVGRYTIIFETKISFPPSLNSFLNAIVPIELVMNINSEIIVRIHFLKFSIIINNRSLSSIL